MFDVYFYWEKVVIRHLLTVVVLIMKTVSAVIDVIY